jgi:putative ABC transport system substrate-binding protein
LFLENYLTSFKAAAASLGMEAIVAPVDDMPGLASLFAIQAREPNSGLVVIPNAFTELHLAEIVALAVRYRVPVVNWSRSFVEGGGLISYGLILSMSTGARRLMLIAS